MILSMLTWVGILTKLKNISNIWNGLPTTTQQDIKWVDSSGNGIHGYDWYNILLGHPQWSQSLQPTLKQTKAEATSLKGEMNSFTKERQN